MSYKYRVQDPRLGRFLSIDPLAAKYPFYSPYAFSGNRVIDAVELEGLEWISATDLEQLPIFDVITRAEIEGSTQAAFIGGEIYYHTGFDVYNGLERVSFHNRAIATDNRLDILGVDGTHETLYANDNGMVELPHSGNEHTGTGTEEYRIREDIVYEYYNRDDEAPPEEQWATVRDMGGLLNSIFEYREIYAGEVIQIGDMRSPTNVRVRASPNVWHHNNNGAVDIRYLGVGGSYHGYYNDDLFDETRNRLFINIMGRNGYSRVFVADDIADDVDPNSNNIDVIEDSPIHDNHLHFDKD